MKEWQHNPEVRKVGLKYAGLYMQELQNISFAEPKSEEDRRGRIMARFYLDVARDFGVDVMFKVGDYNEEDGEDGHNDEERSG